MKRKEACQETKLSNCLEVMEGLPRIEGNNWPLVKVDTPYHDDHHLRGAGAELYSEWLAERVVALMD